MVQFSVQSAAPPRAQTNFSNGHASPRPPWGPSPKRPAEARVPAEAEDAWAAAPGGVRTLLGRVAAVFVGDRYVARARPETFAGVAGPYRAAAKTAAEHGILGLPELLLSMAADRFDAKKNPLWALGCYLGALTCAVALLLPRLCVGATLLGVRTFLVELLRQDPLVRREAPHTEGQLPPRAQAEGPWVAAAFGAKPRPSRPEGCGATAAGARQADYDRTSAQSPLPEGWRPRAGAEEGPSWHEYAQASPPPAPVFFAQPGSAWQGTPANLASLLNGAASGQALRKLVERYQEDPAATEALQAQHVALQAALSMAQRSDASFFFRKPHRAEVAYQVGFVLGEGSCGQDFRRAYRLRALRVHPDKTLALSPAGRRLTCLCFQVTQAAYELALHTFQDP